MSKPSSVFAYDHGDFYKLAITERYLPWLCDIFPVDAMEPFKTLTGSEIFIDDMELFKT